MLPESLDKEKMFPSTNSIFEGLKSTFTDIVNAVKIPMISTLIFTNFLKKKT